MVRRLSIVVVVEHLRAFVPKKKWWLQPTVNFAWFDNGKLIDSQTSSLFLTDLININLFRKLGLIHYKILNFWRIWFFIVTFIDHLFHKASSIFRFVAFSVIPKISYVVKVKHFKKYELSNNIQSSVVIDR